jgi:DNA mismatch repair protein MutH
MGRLPYDDSSIQDIFRYSNELIGLRFLDVLNNSLENRIVSEDISPYNNARRKGSLGNLLEEHYFFYKPNSNSIPDFDKVGMELKVTPYEKTKSGIKAGERLVITMIPNDRPIEIEFKGSHLESKIKLILMIWYLRDRSLPRTEYRIDYVNLYDLYSETCKKDLEIILEDYNIIVEKIISGNAHKLSEGDTKYLGACTKGATAAKSLQPQYYNDEVLAKRRAFSLKQSYMTYILNNYINTGLMNYDSIFSEEELADGDFDQKILDKINKYQGYTEKDLYDLFEIDTKTNSKQINRTLTYRILGVNTEKAEEFEKANIVVKTIRAQKNGLPRESMSFPKIKINDFVKQDFEDSIEYEFFETTRFLFVVFQENSNGDYELKGAKFWNMPIDELETIGKQEWEEYKNKFISGVNFKVKRNKKGDIYVSNDLPKGSKNIIFHLRPHSSRSAYVIDGVRYGRGKDSDMDELPNGDKMTNQCFWFNRSYIANVIKDLLT